jgi:hypothetical protein
MTARVRVGPSGGNTREPRSRVTLIIEYDGKEAFLDLPVPPPLFDLEPGYQAYRREIRSLVMALEEWERSPDAIRWGRDGSSR